MGDHCKDVLGYMSSWGGGGGLGKVGFFISGEEKSGNCAWNDVEFMQ